MKIVIPRWLAVLIALSLVYHGVARWHDFREVIGIGRCEVKS